MTNPTTHQRGRQSAFQVHSSPVSDIVGRARISDVYRALAGADPRRTGSDKWRATATWRGGDGLNVALDDSRGAWHDFVTRQGGGVLDLVVLVRGGSRRDALHWLADLVGVPLEDRRASSAERSRWAAERRAMERDLPAARYWRRGMLVMLESVLDREKDRLSGGAGARPDFGVIRTYNQLIDRLKHAGDAALVSEYREWRTDTPRWASALVRWMRDREQAEVRSLMAVAS
jgi:hypothetical protein